MESTKGIPLSLTGNAIWKGQNQSNGQLELIHNYALEKGYSGLVVSTALAAELAAAGYSPVPFGNAVWYDRNLRATEPNKVYAGIPTAAGAVPRLAGVLKYDSSLASMQPAYATGAMPYNKGVLVKRGFLRYKTAKVAAAGAAIAFADINDATMKLFFELATGDPVLAAPTGWGTSNLAGLTATEADLLVSFLEALGIGVTLPDLTGDTTVANLITHLSKVAVGAVDADALAAPLATKIAGLLQTGSVTLTGAVPTLAGCVYGGDILSIEPEDESVLVELKFA